MAQSLQPRTDQLRGEGITINHKNLHRNNLQRKNGKIKNNQETAR
jgi:hypothetical protein